jgi:hypothetical protein
MINFIIAIAVVLVSIIGLGGIMVACVLADMQHQQPGGPIPGDKPN